MRPRQYHLPMQYQNFFSCISCLKIQNHQRSQDRGRRNPRKVKLRKIVLPYLYFSQKPFVCLGSKLVIWRRRWDSNPRVTCVNSGFRDRPVMTTSVLLQLVVDIGFYVLGYLFQCLKNIYGYPLAF